MAVQATPPIQLDPSMDSGHQLAFTNQNFNNIASVIGQNSFVIIKSGTAPYSYSGGTSTTLTIPHNLGYAPVFLAYLADSQNTFFQQLPCWLSLSVGATSINFSVFTQVSIDITNIYVRTDYTSGTSGSGLTFKYFLLQQTAN